MVEEAMAAKAWPVSEITNTDQISAITSTELGHDEVGDRATMSQKSSRPQVTRFVSRPLMPNSLMRDPGPFASSVAGVDKTRPARSIDLV